MSLPTAPDQFVYSEAAFLIYWELTRSCGLACKHCRAEAIRERDPSELSTEEGKRLLQEIREFGTAPSPHLVVTGGDPLRRDDLFELIDYATDLGIGVSAAPAVTGHLTFEIASRLKDSGIQMVSLSLDGATPQTHDPFRGVPGCFKRTLRALEWMHSVRMPVQINTLVTGDTKDELPKIYDLLCERGASRWSLFFLITVGRGRRLRQLDPEECEKLMEWLYQISRLSPFPIKTTEAPHYRRFFFQRLKEKERGMTATEIRRTAVGRGFGIRDGNGVLFISHVGDVYPSGFLPVSAGNVRKRSIVDIYRNSSLLRDLRDTDQFRGKCGRCEFRRICGGSRARAYAATGDWMASDPLCAHEPSTA